MKQKTNVTSLHTRGTQQDKDDKSVVSSLSPREIVSELDRYVIGQNAAKRAVAIALRNRWRRQALKGASANFESLLDISVLPTPVGPIIKIFLGNTSSFISPFKACLLHLFLRAIATALLAAFWPITYRSNSETISLGDKEETTDLSSFSFDESLVGNEVIFVFCFILLNFF